MSGHHFNPYGLKTSSFLTAQLAGVKLSRPQIETRVGQPQPGEEASTTRLTSYYLQLPSASKPELEVIKIDLVASFRPSFAVGGFNNTELNCLISHQDRPEDDGKRNPGAIVIRWDVYNVTVAITGKGRIDRHGNTYQVDFNAIKVIHLVKISGNSGHDVALDFGTGLAVKELLEKAKVVAFDVYVEVAKEKTSLVD